MRTDTTPTVLTIAGFDPYGGAGVLADTKAIHAQGAYAFAVVAALTAQNGRGVVCSEAVATEMLEAQIAALCEDMTIETVKIGMLSNAASVRTVATLLRRYRPQNVILDPVLRSSSGAVLLDDEGIEAMREELFEICTLITPNLPEAETLLGIRCDATEASAKEVAERFFAMGVQNLLLKGGHAEKKDEAVDYLVLGDGTVHRFATPKIETMHTHGTGCVLSAAIAGALATGKELVQSVADAKAFLYNRLRDAADTLRFPYRDPSLERKEPFL